jgi:hydrophobic/amphiphilic exporter-1 (mainly G- bacteria), HAE1 family
MTVALTASVILFGVFAYLQLPVSDLPAVDYPVIQVQVNYPGATPETMANNVATPLERQFMQIPGLEMVTSNNGQGHSSFVLQFDLSKSLDGAATDVQAAITRATAQLPIDLPRPIRTINRFSIWFLSATPRPKGNSTTTQTRRSASTSAFCPE